MMPVFVTSNKRKIEEAQAVFVQHGLKLKTKALDIHEIQHHNPAMITEAKAKAAYELLKQPVIVNDSSWEIPALNGFPGGYMKDVIEWFSAEDFIALMRGKSDRRIILHDIAAFYDGATYKSFAYTWEGVFTDEPSDGDGASLDRVIRSSDSTLTAAEEYTLQDKKVLKPNETYEGMWPECVKWLIKEGVI